MARRSEVDRSGRRTGEVLSVGADDGFGALSGTEDEAFEAVRRDKSSARLG